MRASPSAGLSARRGAGAQFEGRQQGGKGTPGKTQPEQFRDAEENVRRNSVEEIPAKPCVVEGSGKQRQEERAGEEEHQPRASHSPPGGEHGIVGHGAGTTGYSPPPPMVTFVQPAAAQAFMTSMTRWCWVAPSAMMVIRSLLLARRQDSR